MAVGAIACVDIGSTKVCTIIATVSVVDNRVTEVHGVGTALSQGIQKGVIQDLTGATRVIRDSVEKAQATAQSVSLPYVGFSGKHISSTNPVVTVDPKDHKVTQDALKEAERRILDVKFPDERVRVATVRRQYVLDGTVKGIRNPLDMHAYKLDLEAHIVSAGMPYLQNLEYCLTKAEIPMSADRFVPNALASSEAVLEEEDKEAGVILVDIGGGTTDIAAFKEGSIFNTAVLPVGGSHITSDLAIGLSIPFSVAEELKTKCGLLSGDRLETTAIEIMEKYRISPDELYYIIRARVEEILRMIISKSPHVPTSGAMVLTGGTSKLPGIEEFAQEVLPLPVRLGKLRGLPENLPETARVLDDPAYASSIGLLLWGSKFEEEGRRRPPSISGLSGLYSGLRGGWQFILDLIPFEMKRKRESE